MLTMLVPSVAAAQEIPGTDRTPPDLTDPRYELEPGNHASDDGNTAVDPANLAETVSVGIEHLALTPKPVFPSAPGAFNYSNINSDLAFQGDIAFSGNYLGWGAYDVSDPASPELITTVVCPGGQGDLSVHGDLLFMSVESKRSSTQCDSTGQNPTGWSGIRIFDISDLANPRYVKAVDTCRGSHTHTLVEDLDDPRHVYVYVSGTAGVRSGDGPWTSTCDVGPGPNNNPPPGNFLDEDGNPVPTDRFQIEIIKVPVSAPELSAVVAKPRVMADPETGNPHGLWAGGSHGEGQQSTSATVACHDLTSYPELGLVAGACQGNGIMLDVSNPEAPVRLTDVIDPNFAYWHSATFNNDGTKVVFTDEWGGGTGARCRVTDPANWGANAIFDIVRDGDSLELAFASHYKIPNVQANNETCVAHNGNLIPIPGRDVMVQAWYEGGVSVFDFTDSANPKEIAFFDRGPYHPSIFHQGGYWSVYWHNGAIYGNEIFLGFDSFELTPTDDLTQAEIDAAKSVVWEDQNPQAQRRYEVEPLPERPPVAGCAEVESVSFTDVSRPPHAVNIGCVAGFGVALGFEDGTFRPGADVRRDQMASFLERMLEVGGIELAEPSSPQFTDVPATNRHLGAIERLAEAGIVKGVVEGSYDPSGTVSRAQMASFLVRTLEFAIEADLAAPRAPFTDVASSDTHAGNIDVAYDLKIAEGTTDTTFAPGADVRRDQMGSFLARTLGAMDDFGIALTPRVVD